MSHRAGKMNSPLGYSRYVNSGSPAGLTSQAAVPGEDGSHLANYQLPPEAPTVRNMALFHADGTPYHEMQTATVASINEASGMNGLTGLALIAGAVYLLSLL